MQTVLWNMQIKKANQNTLFYPHLLNQHRIQNIASDGSNAHWHANLWNWYYGPSCVPILLSNLPNHRLSGFANIHILLPGLTSVLRNCSGKSRGPRCRPVSDPEKMTKELGKLQQKKRRVPCRHGIHNVWYCSAKEWHNNAGEGVGRIGGSHFLLVAAEDSGGEELLLQRSPHSAATASLAPSVGRWLEKKCPPRENADRVVQKRKEISRSKNVWLIK